jgi:hypothetical protein
VSAEAYRELFVDFCRAELASGGPDPQVTLVGRAVRERTDLVPAEQAVRCGLFVVPYTVGAGAVLWNLRDWGQADWASFLIEHKDGFPMRRERRSVWGDDRRKLMESVVSWIDFCYRVLPDAADGTYDELYASIGKYVKYFGRYATMKVIETMHQAGLHVPAQSSIVAKGAKYPRKMLAMLFPEHAERMNSKANDTETIKLANDLAYMAYQFIGERATWFQLETLLCNARQAHDGKYPGRSHDRELAHWRKANGYFRRKGMDLREVIPFYGLRQTLFPHEYLGELGAPPWWQSREHLEVAQKEKVRGALADR